MEYLSNNTWFGNNTSTGKRTIVLLLVGLFIFSTPIGSVFAEKMPVPPEIQVTLLLKILTYDRALKDRCTESINIGVLYSKSDDESKEAKAAILKVLEKISDRTISKLPFTYTALEWDSKESLISEIKEKNINVLYVTPGNSAILSDLIKITQSNNILSMTGVPKYVKKGVSISIGLKNEKPQIVINLDSAKSEGADLDAKLLRIARLEETE